MDNWPPIHAVCVNTYHLRNLNCAVTFSLRPLADAIDVKHIYKAPHANRPGDRPYERKTK